MATRDFFYDSVDGDREYGSQSFAQWSKGILSEGYVPGVGDELEVTESSPAAMSVRVGLGIAWVDGRFFEVYDSAETLTIPAADGSNPRIDRVVVRNDLDARETVLAVKTGSPASDPDPPSLTRTETVYEISLAQVAVAAGATSVTNSDITDERDDEDVCGAAVANAKPVSATGSYVGDATVDRLIATDFDPVLVYCADSAQARGIGLGGLNMSVSIANTGSGSSDINSTSISSYRPRPTTGGFLVSGAITGTLNHSGRTFEWIAIG